MKLTIAILALCLAQALCDSACPAPSGDLKDKQAKIQDILEHVNRPFSPDHHKINTNDARLKGLGVLKDHDVFSLFDERQWPEIKKVFTLLTGAKTFDEFIEISEAVRHVINDDMFLFVFTSAIVHRADTQGVHAPRVQDIYPDKFLTQDVITRIKESINRGEALTVVNASHDYWDTRDINNRLSYFTEDLGLNAIHYHWHTVNPAVWKTEFGGEKERRGESFYWMHRQMVARYDAERLSNNLPRTKPFENWDSPIREGYAPHLTIDRTGYIYMFRPDGVVLPNLPELTKNQMRLWKSRILNCIHRGFVYHKNGTQIDIRHMPYGIDVIANLVEASFQTVNFNFYGNLHNYAHVLASRIVDPDGKYEQDNGAMYDIATSARDPLFYKWHKFIDNIFQEYKDTLPTYTPEEVTWPDVEIETLSVKGDKSDTPNKLTTFWDTDIIKVGKHLSFTGEKTADVRVKHLQHEGFNFKLDISNKAADAKEAMVRIFLAPKYNEQHKAFKPNEQRQLVIELDRFITKLKPGKNAITRHSSESSVTIADKQIFAPVDTLVDSKDQCKCGWPNYLLLPRGKPEGMVYQLFAVVTNWAKDKVSDDISCMCKGSPSYCRFLYGKIGDSRPLGYPFDRKIVSTSWDEIKIQNLLSTELVIKFTGDNLTPPPQA